MTTMTDSAALNLLAQLMTTDNQHTHHEAFSHIAARLREPAEVGVAGLAQKWHEESGIDVPDEELGNYWLGRRHCARELEAAIAAAPQPPAEAQAQAISPEWSACRKRPVVVHVREQRAGEQHVSTREGITPVKPDDLIMRGVEGEEYPIGRDLFNKTYDLVDEAQAQYSDVISDGGVDPRNQQAQGGGWCVERSGDPDFPQWAEVKELIVPAPPSAPVGVEESLDRLRQHRSQRLWKADLVGGQISVERMRAILHVALAQQPAAVEGAMSPQVAKLWLLELMGDHDFTIPSDAFNELVSALAQPQGASHDGQ